MFFNYIDSALIRKNIGLYIFSFALVLGQNNPNYSLSFDGQTGYVSIPDSPSLNFGSSSISYSLWFKKPTANHYLQILHDSLDIHKNLDFGRFGRFRDLPRATA